MKAKLHLKIIALFSYLIPRRFRSDWAEEWNAELQYRESKPGRDLLRPSLGAFWDALAMQSRRLEEEFWQDVRFGVRTFASSRGVTAAVILSLALGIGLNTAIFSVTDPLLLKKLPVRNPDELVLFQWTMKTDGPSYAVGTSGESRHYDAETGISTGGVFSFLAFERFREKVAPLAEVFAFSRLSAAPAIVDGQAELVTGQWVSGGYFESLGIAASIGRAIAKSDDRASASPVALLSHSYWSRRFAADRAVLGKVINVGGNSFTIAGVAPPGFGGTLQVDDAPDLYLPMGFEPAVQPTESKLSMPDFWWVWIMARPRSGISPERLRDELNPVFQQAGLEGFQQAVREKRMSASVRMNEVAVPHLAVVSGSRGLDDSRQTYETVLLVLAGLALLVFLIACVNVANLLLSRAATRQHEIAVRVAMGAGRIRLIRQLLTESLLLAACGGVCGVVAAYYGKSLLLNWGPWDSLAAGISPSLDIAAFSFSAGLTLFASILSGVIPAFVVTRREPGTTLKAHARTVSRSSSIGKVLLAGQAAMSVMLLIGAGLFVATVHNLRSLVIVAEPAQVLQFTVDASLYGYDRNKTAALWKEILERIGTVPGVKTASFVSTFSMSPMAFRHPSPGIEGYARRIPTGPGFFGTMGIPLVAGRELTASDNSSAPRVVVVNEALVREFFPNETPIGKEIGGTIVGVARDLDYSDLRKKLEPAIFSPYQQPTNGPPISLMTFQIRTVGDPLELLSSIRVAVHQADPLVVPSDVGTLAHRLDNVMATENMFARLSTLFGAVALLLTSIGLFGMLSYGVARRTKEFGVRLAMGARPSYVMRLVLQDGMTLVVIGIAIGIGGALVSVRYIAGHLFGLVPNNPFVIAGAAITVMAIAIVASLTPARRASRVVPVDALRYE